MKLSYRSDLKHLARELRNHSTLAEVLLWKHLKARQRRLESLGIRFLKFGDAEVKRNAAGVAAAIDAWIDSTERERTSS